MTCKRPNPYGSSDPIPAPVPPADLKSRMKNTYNSIARHYNNWSLVHDDARYLYTEDLLSAVRDARLATHGRDDYGLVNMAGVKALELGCGHGGPVIAKLLHERIWNIVGVDMSASQLELARGYFEAAVVKGWLTLVEGDIMELEYEEGEFDIVVSLYTMHHLPTEEQRELLQRVQRWLKPGGFILMNFPTEELKGEVIKKWLGREEGWIYSAAFGKEKTLEMLKELEFEVIFQEMDGDPTSDAEFLWVIAKTASSESKDWLEDWLKANPKEGFGKGSNDGSQKGDETDSQDGSEAGSKANSKEGSPA